ncbi:hypothetical protein [Cocleimonas flava]|nr:hypothetical protein [Cocleimonas flava]
MLKECFNQNGQDILAIFVGEASQFNDFGKAKEQYLRYSIQR